MDYLAFIDKYGLYLIPAFIVAIINYKNAAQSYKPILWYIFFLAFNQIIEIILIETLNNNLPAYNISGLVGFLLFLYIISSWGYLQKNKKMINALAIICVILFCIEVIYNGGLFKETNYSKAFYSFLTILFALNAINQTLFKESGLGIFNAKNLFCITMIIESCFWIYLAIFLNTRLNFTLEFLEAIYLVYRYCKIFLISSLYLFTCLKIPKSKSNFITFNN